MNERFAHLKPVLEKLYRKYNKRELIKPDPLQFVYRYDRRCDMEMAGFLASALAYGRVQQIEKSLENLLGRMGASPYEFVKNFDEDKRLKLRSFRHRFTTGDDVADLLEIFSNIFENFGNIEIFFGEFYNKADKNILGALSGFCKSLTEIYTAGHNGNVSRQIKYLLASPERKSACKRLNLFLRWMVRSDNVDAGIWKSIDESKLIVPVDVHMGRLCGILGLSDHKTVSLNTAVKITENFAQISPKDPVKYDFALSRVGIVEDCNGKYRPECEVCDLASVCVNK